MKEDCAENVWRLKQKTEDGDSNVYVGMVGERSDGGEAEV